MNSNALTQAFSGWMGSVAATLVAWLGRLRSPRCVRLLEGESDTFRLEATSGRADPRSSAERLRIGPDGIVGEVPASLATAVRGSRAELVLNPSRFLARPLELPKRATEFLDGIVRAQIDRLTPWSASDAVFGWTSPIAIDKDRIRTTVVATARPVVAPYLQALAGLGAGSVVISTIPPGGDAGATPITIAEQGARGALNVGRVQRMLAIVLVALGLAAGLATAMAQFVNDGLDAQQQDLARRIAERRVAMRRDGSGGTPAPQRALDLRKQQTPSSVVVLEALSQVLPDHTYVTELRVEGDKLQVIGVTRDAPSLIRLIEQSPHFTRATFFAPTTRSAGDPGERFHIEARIKPVFGART
jgi:general secretion pathway protein L